MKKLKNLFIELNPKQNISVAEIKKNLPSLRGLHILSPDLNAEKQKQIFNDFKQHKFHIDINGEQYSSALENMNQKRKILKC